MSASCNLIREFCSDARYRGTYQALIAIGDYGGCGKTAKPKKFSLDLKNVKSLNIEQEPEFEDLEVCACGTSEVIGQFTVKEKWMFALAATDLTADILKLAMRGVDQDTIVQPALSLTPLVPIDYSTETWSSGCVHVLCRDVLGTETPVYSITDLKVTPDGSTTDLIDGTDYVYNPHTGEIKFLTPQTQLLNIVASTDAKSVTPFELGASAPLDVYIRILYTPMVDTVGDQCQPEMIFEAAATATFEDSLEGNKDDFAELSMKFTSKGRPVLTDLRNY